MSKPLASEFAKQGDKYIGTAYSKLDCQAFFEAMLKGVGITTNLAGSNAWYREMMKSGWVGTVGECVKKFGKVPVGAALFIWEADGEPAKYVGDGIGNLSHIGVYTGRSGSDMCKNTSQGYNYGDGAIHSSASRGCVCTSKFAGKEINGGWNRVGLWDKLDYGIGNTQQSTQQEGGVLKMQAKVVSGNGLGVNLRTGKSTATQLIMSIPENATVDIIEQGDEWSKISYNGKVGYAKSEFLSVSTGNKVTLTLDKSVAEALYSALGMAFGDEGVG